MKWALMLAVILFTCPTVRAQELSPAYYDIGTPAVTDIYVDPVNGNDSRSGASAALAFKTVTAAWNSIPNGRVLTGTGYRVIMLPGTFREADIPNYWENHFGTRQFPIIFQPRDGQGTVRFAGDINMFNSRFVYFLNFTIEPDPAGDPFHCEQCTNLLLRGMTISGGGDRVAHEGVKINQSQYVYIENSNISNAEENPLDFVSVQYGHLIGNKIHNGGDWCAYLKGGAAQFTIEGNEFTNCFVGGFTAGQGTGLEYMTSPWLHYEAYDLKIVNNVFHNLNGAAIGVNGGYNILFAYNTFYKVGTRSHAIEVVYGLRSCDSERAACEQRYEAGAWGSQASQEDPIGNRNVYILNNVLLNPAGTVAPQYFSIQGPRTARNGSNIPSPQSTDTNLVIRGNVLFNGDVTTPLGIEDADQGCRPSNPTCNEDQLRANNVIGTIMPQLSNPPAGDYRPSAGSNLFTGPAVTLFDFPGGDRVSTPLAPQGTLTNSVGRDRGFTARTAVNPAGAYFSVTTSAVPQPPTTDIPNLPGDTGNGGGTNALPVATGARITMKKVPKRIRAVTVEVTAVDDTAIASVTATVSSGSGVTGQVNLRRVKQTDKFKGATRLKAKAPFSATIVATDDQGGVTSIVVGR